MTILLIENKDALNLFNKNLGVIILSNRTLAILKPDCVEKNLIGQVIQKINEAGFKVLGNENDKTDK